MSMMFMSCRTYFQPVQEDIDGFILILVSSNADLVKQEVWIEIIKLGYKVGGQLCSSYKFRLLQAKFPAKKKRSVGIHCTSMIHIPSIMVTLIVCRISISIGKHPQDFTGEVCAVNIPDIENP
jgi:hypothetical protein